MTNVPEISNYSQTGRNGRCTLGSLSGALLIITFFVGFPHYSHPETITQQNEKATS